ncbi:MAG: DUF481 domain-containing protein [Chromatiales bacterium]|nr:MAG: DUF481 domain-containing protein [Chromatiales bacterium]
MRMPFVRYSLVVLLILGLSSPVSADSDVLTIVNGDRLTGEVKSLERGKLRFDTSATGTIPIEWDEVAFLTSNQNIQVETVSGDRYLGRLISRDRQGFVNVGTEIDSVEIAMESIVLMTPIEERGIDRFDGDITAGFNFAKASEVRQAQLGFELQARTETRIFGLDAASVTSDSQDNESSQRHSLDLTYQRLWPKRWLTGALVRLERNDELDLDLRTSIGVGGGRNVLQTNTATLSLTGGLQLSRENLSGNVTDEDTVEAFATLNWDWFRYDTPELDLSTTLQIIPNLTDAGRVRAELDISLRWEVIADLFWQLEFYDSYDSDPVVEGAEENDYGVITSLGWDF